MELVLPKGKVAADEHVVSKLIVVGHQGSGKTKLSAELPNSLLIDLENGSNHVEAQKINVVKYANENNIGIGRALEQTISLIKSGNKDNGKFLYDFIIVDGVTALEKIARAKATVMFRNSTVGKGMINKGAVINDVVTDVPDSGWLWFFNAWESLYNDLQGLCSKAIIFIAHSKQGSMMKEGIKIDAADMQLSGKAKLDLLRDADACGFVYKKDANTVMISFKQNERDLTIKSRAKHLHNQEFIISEMKEDGSLVTYWDKIFLNLNKK